ncbi:c-type cytochrome [Bradyrhizobium betae]|uniref:Cytochrome c n=1 Tax=Bradyrhizobium betae TaxID=244734 RepID=A0A5P6P790_9BRAD|nr:cytochrome c [Bradyrhizobium betae]MCS3731518.1 mono/diheme cytochrome c family protein [Bradyrhizobium betae]QFI74086.1 cytochrome c [Bradyrhizobium betae]
MAALTLLAGLKQIGAASVVVVLSVATGSSPAFPAGDGVWRGGADIYSKICTYCHDVGVGPVIKGRQLPPETITQVVRRGLIEMPAFPVSFIDDKSLQDLAKYISQSAAPRK